MTTYFILRDPAAVLWDFWLDADGELIGSSTLTPPPFAVTAYDALKMTDALASIWYLFADTEGELQSTSVSPGGSIFDAGTHLTLVSVAGDRYRLIVFTDGERQIIQTSTRGDLMPDTFELALSLLKNGKPFPGLSPYTRRLTVDQAQDFDEILEAGSGDTALPIAQVDAVTLLLVQGSQAQLLKLGDIRLYPGGLVLLWNAQNTTETLNNDSAMDARNIGVAGGS